jgi:hypothetical protein
MTEQYLVGEMSLLLAQLQAVAEDHLSAECAARLRRNAERLPPYALTGIERSALALADDLCWASLARGDLSSFDRQARVGAQLREFGVCSGLLRDR